MIAMQTSGSGNTFLLAVAFFFRKWEVPSGSGNFLTSSGNALCILFPTTLTFCLKATVPKELWLLLFELVFMLPCELRTCPIASELSIPDLGLTNSGDGDTHNGSGGKGNLDLLRDNDSKSDGGAGLTGKVVILLSESDMMTRGANTPAHGAPVVAGNQSNGSAGKARVETVPDKDYILLPLWTQDPLFSSSSKDSPGDGFKPSGEEEKKDAEYPKNEDNEDNAVDENIVYGCVDDPNMPNLEEIVYSDDDEDVGAEADMTNLDTNIIVSLILTTRIHKDHRVKQIIRDIHSTPQTRRMTKNVTNHGMFSSVQQRINHKDFQNCLFAYFLSQVEPKKVIQALTDPSWIEAMQDELLQFKLQQVWTLMDLPNGKRAIGIKWIYKNKKYERGIVVRNKARLVAHGYTQEEGIDYDEVFDPVARIEAIRLFLAHDSFKYFFVYHMDVKSVFLYLKIEEVYKEGDVQDKYVHEFLKKFDFSTVKTASTPMETSKPLMKDENAKDVDVHLYRSMISSLMYLTSSRLDIMFADSPFDLEAYTNSDYASASLDRKYVTKAYLEKLVENADFAEIVDFLNANLIKCSLTVSPTIYVPYIEQFWSTTKTKIDNNETQIRAKVDGKTIVITESSVKSDL
nr:putative ribonuclease H-like domain-containing protein [Tanacetum cinerariifolium]